MKVPKKVKAPQGKIAIQLTEDREYDVLKILSYHPNTLFSIKTDNSTVPAVCRLQDCQWLNGQDWIVTEWQEIN